ncbi:hypothetical protein F7725_002379 [Dissostichus mawsoni]|uniref:Uncharacterized protein n=1 Tax=Dissostichus mawsoni TaxID=36200 RepID=A0A7J5Y2G2_DISMA|nr:hypothetical protein F7725_002379 [Dissostichus mawsoni]
MRLTVCSPQESSGSHQMTQERDTGFQSVQLRRRAADILILKFWQPPDDSGKGHRVSECSAQEESC